MVESNEESFRHWNTLLPAGMHRFTVVDVERRQSRITERYFWDVSFVLEGTDRLEHDYFSEPEKAAWKLSQIGLDHINDLETLVGQTFVVEYEHANIASGKVGRIRQYLAKVIN